MFYAEVLNQYGRRLGDGTAATREEAITKANTSANNELTHANPNWRWRKAKTKVTETHYESKS